MILTFHIAALAYRGPTLPPYHTGVDPLSQKARGQAASDRAASTISIIQERDPTVRNATHDVVWRLPTAHKKKVTGPLP